MTSPRFNRKRLPSSEQAVRKYASPLEPLAEQEGEAAIVRRHRTRLAQQGRALVREQARPRK